MNSSIVRIVASGVLALTVVTTAQAGCFKGAVVGAIAGHYAHHHAVLGAMAGCAVGHHLAVEARKQRTAAQHPKPSQPQPAHN
jgi:hydroxyethylthiazole kinase-like sugar kinase family protein